jgi:hypothetical protein
VAVVVQGGGLDAGARAGERERREDGDGEKISTAVKRQD